MSAGSSATGSDLAVCGILHISTVPIRATLNKSFAAGADSFSAALGIERESGEVKQYATHAGAAPATVSEEPAA